MLRNLFVRFGYDVNDVTVVTVVTETLENDIINNNTQKNKVLPLPSSNRNDRHNRHIVTPINSNDDTQKPERFVKIKQREGECQSPGCISGDPIQYYDYKLKRYICKGCAEPYMGDETPLRKIYPVKKSGWL